MNSPSAPGYEIDQQWKIVKVNDAFCREVKCSESGLIGRDIRDLMRIDWRPDFRAAVSRALVGVGEATVTLPMIAPCGEQGWYQWRAAPRTVWNFEAEQLSKAS